MSHSCIAHKDDGSLCGEPAIHFDRERGGMVCEAHVSSTSSSEQPRPVGLGAGEFTVPENFDDPLPEDILRDFEGRD